MIEINAHQFVCFNCFYTIMQESTNFFVNKSLGQGGYFIRMLISESEMTQFAPNF